MVRYHAKCLFRDLVLALRGKGPWFEVRYHAITVVDSTLIHPFRTVWYSLVNLYHYLPIIWSDRDWDYSCMLTLWAKKFDRMAYLHEHYGHHVGKEKVARDLRVCASLCRRIRDDSYTEAALKEHEEQFGTLTMFTTPTEHKTHRVNFRFTKTRTAEEEAWAHWQWHRIVNHCEQVKANDLQFLCRTISREIWTWWD